MLDIKDTIIHISSRFSGVLFAFLLNSIVMRNLSTSDFGVYSFSLALIVIGTEISGKGMDPAIIKICSSNIKNNRDFAMGTLKAGFIIRVIITILFLIAAFIIGRPVIASLKDGERLLVSFNYALTGFIIMSVLSYIFTIMQSLEQFGKWAALNTFLFGGRLLAVLFILFIISPIALSSALNAYIASTLAALILGIYLTSPAFLLHRIKDHKGIYSELINFSKWTLLSSILYIINSKIDLIILTILSNTTEAGVYSSAVMVIFAIDMITVSFATLLLPKVSRFDNADQRRDYINRVLILSCVMTLVLSPIFFCSSWIMTLIGGERFKEAGQILSILYPAPFFTLIMALSILVIYNLNAPYITVLTSFITLILNISGYLIFIPRFGAKGAAYVTLFSRMIEGLAVLGIAGYLTKRSKEGSNISSPYSVVLDN